MPNTGSAQAQQAGRQGPQGLGAWVGKRADAHGEHLWMQAPAGVGAAAKYVWVHASVALQAEGDDSSPQTVYATLCKLDDSAAAVGELVKPQRPLRLPTAGSAGGGVHVAWTDCYNLHLWEKGDTMTLRVFVDGKPAPSDAVVSWSYAVPPEVIVAALEAPRNLRATLRAPWNVELEWDAVQGADGYRVDIEQAPGAPTEVVHTTEPRVVVASRVASQRMRFAVRATVERSFSGPPAKLEQQLPNPNIPGLRKTFVTHRLIGVAWDADANAAPFAGYAAQARAADDEFSILFSIDALPTSSRSAVFAVPPQDTPRDFAVHVLGLGSNGWAAGASDTLVVTVPPKPSTAYERRAAVKGMPLPVAFDSPSVRIPIKALSFPAGSYTKVVAVRRAAGSPGNFLHLFNGFDGSNEGSRHRLWTGGDGEIRAMQGDLEAVTDCRIDEDAETAIAVVYDEPQRSLLVYVDGKLRASAVGGTLSNPGVPAVDDAPANVLGFEERDGPANFQGEYTTLRLYAGVLEWQEIAEALSNDGAGVDLVARAPIAVHTTDAEVAIDTSGPYAFTPSTVYPLDMALPPGSYTKMLRVKRAAGSDVAFAHLFEGVNVDGDPHSRHRIWTGAQGELLAMQGDTLVRSYDAALRDDAEVHVAAVYEAASLDSGTLTLYIDGERVDSAPAGANAGTTRNFLGFEDGATYTANFTGSVRDIRVYGRALRDAEVAAIAANVNNEVETA